MEVKEAAGQVHTKTVQAHDANLLVREARGRESCLEGGAQRLLPKRLCEAVDKERVSSTVCARQGEAELEVAKLAADEVLVQLEIDLALQRRRQRAGGGSRLCGVVWRWRRRAKTSSGTQRDCP